MNSALEGLPHIEPSFSPVNGEPGGSSYGFFVVLERDKDSKAYKLINRSTTAENRKKEHPFAKNVGDLTFPGCEGTKPELLRGCFDEKFTAWLLGNADPEIIKRHTGVGGSVKLTYDESGKPESYIVYCASDEVKNEFERILSKLPNVKPGTMNGKTSKLTYSVPFTL